MKLIIAASLLFALGAQAFDFAAGTQFFRDCRDFRVMGDELIFAHKEGTSRVRRDQLPESMREKYFPAKKGELERVKMGSIGLDAALLSAGASAVDKFKTDYGSSEVHTRKQRSVAGSVRNYGTKEADLALRTVWIGKFTGSNERLILNTDTRFLKLRPGATTQFASDSGPVEGSDLNLVLIGYRSTTGARLEGWVVMVRDMATGKLVAMKASDTHLQDYVRDPSHTPDIRSEIVTYNICTNTTKGHIGLQGTRFIHVLGRAPGAMHTNTRGLFTIGDAPYKDGSFTMVEYSNPRSVPAGM